MVVVALVAVIIGALKLRQRGTLLRREAARQAEGETEWTRRRDQYRKVLARMKDPGSVRGFYYRSVLYGRPEQWEKAMGEIIAFHARRKQVLERAADRPWEIVPVEPLPKALAKHVDVEAKLEEAIAAERAAKGPAQPR